MFTEELINSALSKVQSGADFPKYVQELIEIGVTYYEIFVQDGHTIYYGADDYSISTSPKYDELSIAEFPNIEGFQNALYAHQNGETDYFTFCKQTAESGVYKWIVDTEEMLCTYFDRHNGIVLSEIIPEV